MEVANEEIYGFVKNYGDLRVAIYKMDTGTLSHNKEYREKLKRKIQDFRDYSGEFDFLVDEVRLSGLNDLERIL